MSDRPRFIYLFIFTGLLVISQGTSLRTRKAGYHGDQTHFRRGQNTNTNTVFGGRPSPRIDKCELQRAPAAISFIYLFVLVESEMLILPKKLGFWNTTLCWQWMNSYWLPLVFYIGYLNPSSLTGVFGPAQTSVFQSTARLSTMSLMQSVTEPWSHENCSMVTWNEDMYPWQLFNSELCSLDSI